MSESSLSPSPGPASDSASNLDVPATGFWNRVEEIDDIVDSWFDILRGNPALDRLFYRATELGDWSLIWHLLAAAGAVRTSRLEGNAVRVIAALGAESLLVNGVLKSLVGRKRPVAEFERPLHLRIPRTSSFPSGHASSATMAAILLAEKDPRFKAVYAATAAMVASSRIYVRIHHASDIVGGVVTGAVLARMVQRLTERVAPNL